jgi:hypothetical protein
MVYGPVEGLHEQIEGPVDGCNEHDVENSYELVRTNGRVL